MKKILIATGLCTSMVAGAATTFNHYGFVKASYMMTNQVKDGSEHQPFLAQNDPNGHQEEPKAYIAAGQTRWGMTAANGSKTTAKLEFDLEGSQTNGATSASATRIRQANITYKMSENGTLTFGKKWTKFMGVLPATYGFTRVNFYAGNNGFFVDGLDYTHQMGKTELSIELADTNPGIVAGSSSDDVNLVSTPTTTLVLNHKIGDHKVGLAHTMSELKYKSLDEDNNKDSSASGTKVYWAGKYNMLHVAAEYFTGSNLGSIHTGALGKAAATTDDEVKESGYFLSLKYAISDWSVFTGYGIDELNKEEEAGDGGASKNSLIRLGFDKVLDPGLTAFVEYDAYTTSYYVAADDESEDFNGSAIEIGMVYKF